MKPDTNRRRILVALECLSYDELMEYETPNIDALDPHPATAMGCTTRASVPALLGGFLPFCNLGNRCDKNHVDMHRSWTYPHFMTEYHEQNKLWLYCPNGWVAEIINPYLRDEIQQMITEHYAIPDREGEFEMMIDDFISRKPNQMKAGYFAYFHVMETHPPYYPVDCDIPRDTTDREEKEERRALAVKQVDKSLKRLIELDVEDLIITADHPRDHLGTQVFLATRVRE